MKDGLSSWVSRVNIEKMNTIYKTVKITILHKIVFCLICVYLKTF